MQITSRPHLSIHEFTNDLIWLDVKCPVCTETHALEPLDFNKLHHWVTGGGLIQRVFPELDASTREALMSGICDTCWDKMGED